MSDFKYLIVDAQWLLTRNYKVKCNFAKQGDIYTVDGKVIGDENNKPYYRMVPGFDSPSLMTVFFQSIAKFLNEQYTAEKVILVWDKYPYHKFEFLKDYKGSRVYTKQEDVDKLDPIKDVKEIIESQLDVDHLKLKQEAKYAIIREFGKIGLPSFVKTGYEADDLAGEIAKYLSQNSNEKSALLSIDSDWDYLVQPNVVHIRPTGKIVTYEDMMARVSELGIPLYLYKSYEDSLYGSHNDLIQTINPDLLPLKSFDVIKSMVVDGKDVVADKERFEAQLKSFSVVDYPEYDRVLMMLKHIDTCGSVADPIQFGIFAAENKLNVSIPYYNNFANKLNTNLYKDELNEQLF